MKWYERQKQIYAQKNQPDPYTQPKKDAAAYEEQEPIQTQDVNETQEPQDANHANAYDEMLNENGNPDAFEQPEEMYRQEAETYNEPPFRSLHMAQHEEDATTISKSTSIIGNIETDGDLIIKGHVKGDILCNASLSVYGVVEGTISCNNAYLDNAMVIGDIGCSGNMQVTQSSTVNGNVEAYELLNGGRIKGNAAVTQSIRFLATSAIVGNISANDIQVERGAIIQGNVTIRQEVYFNEN